MSTDAGIYPYSWHNRSRPYISSEAAANQIKHEMANEAAKGNGKGKRGNSNRMDGHAKLYVGLKCQLQSSFRLAHAAVKHDTHIQNNTSKISVNTIVLGSRLAHAVHRNPTHNT